MWPDESDKSLRIWKSGKRRVGDEKLQRVLQSTPIKLCSCSALLMLLLLWLFPPCRSFSLRVGSLVFNLRELPWRHETLLIHISPWHNTTPFSDFVFSGSLGQNNSLTVASLICSVGGRVGSRIESIEPRIDSARALIFFFFLDCAAALVAANSNVNQVNTCGRLGCIITRCRINEVKITKKKKNESGNTLLV